MGKIVEKHPNVKVTSEKKVPEKRCIVLL